MPYVVDYIVNQWDWRPWRTVPLGTPLSSGGPMILPPGYVSDTEWTIVYEDAYGWASDFTQATLGDGPLKRYLDERGLAVECETNYAISLYETAK